MNENPFKMPAYIEIMGRSKLSGIVSEQVIAGMGFVRVDVPATDSQPAYTRYINPSSVFSITPVTEEVMLAMAKNMEVKPVDVWDIREMLDKKLIKQPVTDDDDDAF